MSKEHKYPEEFKSEMRERKLNLYKKFQREEVISPKRKKEKKRNNLTTNQKEGD